MLFLSFAPVEFMGGFEKWLYNICDRLSQKEETVIINCSPKIANLYGQIVLGRTFDDRMGIEKSNLDNVVSLGIKNFIPFTRPWRKTKNFFKSSRVIYIKFELIETFIVIYFLGLKGLKKTIAGLHSAFIYKDPHSFFDYLHKAIYESFLTKYFLQNMKVIHVINKNDGKFLKETFGLKKVSYIPNGISPFTEKTKDISQKSKTGLNILFVGELSKRKGVDALIKTVSLSPANFRFKIAGSGAMEKEVIALSEKFPNCEYLGYVENSKLGKYYRKSDVLFVPSKAEGMSLAMLEAMSFGLKIVNSKNTHLSLPNFVEYTNLSLSVSEYLNIFKKIYKLKLRSQLRKNDINDYFEENFTQKKVMPKIINLLVSP